MRVNWTFLMWIQCPKEYHVEFCVGKLEAAHWVYFMFVTANLPGKSTLGVQREQAVGVTTRMPLHARTAPGERRQALARQEDRTTPAKIRGTPMPVRRDQRRADRRR